MPISNVPRVVTYDTKTTLTSQSKHQPYLYQGTNKEHQSIYGSSVYTQYQVWEFRKSHVNKRLTLLVIVYGIFPWDSMMGPSILETPALKYSTLAIIHTSTPLTLFFCNLSLMYSDLLLNLIIIKFESALDLNHNSEHLR